MTRATFCKIGRRDALRLSLDVIPSPVSLTSGGTLCVEKAAVGSPNRGPGLLLVAPAMAGGAGGVGDGGGESRN
jgi:hypothetical protein